MRSSDIKQAFSRYRSDIGDCLISSFYVLRNEMLGTLVATVNAQLGQIATSSTAPTTAEAAIYCIMAIQEAVPEDEDVYLDRLFSGPFLSILSNAGTNHAHIRLQMTALRLIGPSMSPSHASVNAHPSAQRCTHHGSKPIGHICYRLYRRLSMP